MNEIERIVSETARLAEPYLLATVVRVAGSSYRRPGARMLVAGERWLAGCVSGGCLEGDVMLRGAHRCAHGPVVVTYDSSRDDDDGEAWRAGLGCDGVVDVLLELVPAGGACDALVFARACFAAEQAGVLVTVIASRRADVPVGARVAVGPACVLVHAVEPADARAELAAAARGAAGVREVGELVVLVERIAPSPQLFVLGSGHDAAPLARIAAQVGFRVTVADRALREPSRLAGAQLVSTGGDLAALRARIDAAAEAYVVVMHHQRDADRAGLALAIASRARFIGVLGPARRSRELLGDAAADPRVRAPVGLDIGAETPEQIALAIAGELVAAAHGAGAGFLHARARPLHAVVATIVLAAGGSRRLGQPKQLLAAGGVALVRRVAATCIDARLGPVAVVLGAHADEVDAALGELPVARLRNAAWSDGIASSLRAGVVWAEASGATALVVALGDQPRLAAAHLGALRAAWLGGAAMAGSRYAGVVGAPALFDRARWAELARLSGDRGAGALLRGDGVTAIDWPDGEIDIDTPADLAQLHDGGPAS